MYLQSDPVPFKQAEPTFSIIPAGLCVNHNELNVIYSIPYSHSGLSQCKHRLVNVRQSAAAQLEWLNRGKINQKIVEIRVKMDQSCFFFALNMSNTFMNKNLERLIHTHEPTD